ncbi:hypothetical protein PN419_15200 [Halorubrum ezzemoulense]|jgi:hypothetical protein|uniref:Uncharacterized protein n=2 Tax=Halorubrum ezzemoulense TaxID=337243 RepID=A0A256JJR1_HALEZ|nr:MULTISPECIES: hypothetical protein [Halorubrum]MDB2223900.1 hypothetical protein [Halorubrum ezzemoulense]MDB2236316.1 hypothetical protein [Halorubrum ezzemoulense]MDB2241326.1 hypothetical protein [Halorubrum ezzemoulense]MDB2245028.1 hypothetical protein [Halorubrum ezzemoulense]MDB2248396.1 hypothetical protein [Halorubrum ezzemoulense]
MTPPTTDGPPAPTTSREEAWVAHAALLDAARSATDDEAPYHRPIESLERGAALDDEGVALLRDALVDYLGDAPVRDRAPGRALLRRTDEATDRRSRRA